MTLALSPWEAAAAMFERPVRRWASPLDMACELNPQTIRTPALEVINAALVRLADKPGQGRLALQMPPQEGKSTLCSYWNPLWLLAIDPDLRLILMVDLYPLNTALQGVSQAVEVGLDDALLKPVEPSLLLFSISRALERRRLLLENERLLL